MTSHDKPGHTYEPPALSTLGTLAELTQITKSGPVPDTGAETQPSVN